jgi:hypothetical protein
MNSYISILEFMSKQPKENIFSEFAQAVLGNQLDEFRKVAVSARTNLVKLLQGEVEDISVHGQNVTKNDIEIQDVEVQTGQISIDPLSVLLGKIHLNEPLDSNIRLVLSEENLNQNMNSEYAKNFPKSIELNVDREIVSLELQLPLSIRLLENNRMRFTGNVDIRDANKTKKMAFTAIICPRTETEPIRLETFCCTPNSGQSFPLMVSLMQWAQNLINQPYLEIEGIAFRVKTLSIQNKELIAEIEVHASEIPSL